MIFALALILPLAALGFSLADAVVTAKEEHGSARARVMQMQLAESALDAALFSLEAGESGTLGSATAPIRLGGGEFWSEATPLGDGTWNLVAVGRYEGHARALQGIARESKPVFHHAIFAGNSSGDPDYRMKFGGLGEHADDINGDVYSGGGILVEDDADLSGTLGASGEIEGATGDTGVTQVGFDFSKLDLSDPAIVDVRSEFQAWGTSVDHAAGGTAGQVPETNAAHIFRLNPSDRTSETGGTAKDDYFLEDPYEEVRVDAGDEGTDPYMVSIDEGSGVSRRTYFIDGNLWIHNRPSLSFMLESAPGTGTQITFIVKGNITFSDSFRMQNPSLDGVGFVAVVDPNVSDSGNIYLGDPSGGTLKELQAYLYAENDFLDVNLDADGSKSVRVLGAMTAGNQVAIERTYGSDGEKHSKLTVDWDERLKTGALSLPLLDQKQIQITTWSLEMWLEASVGGN